MSKVVKDSTFGVRDYDDAMKAGDWNRASQVFRHHVPRHNQMQLNIVGFDGNTIAMTMELSGAMRGLAEGSVHGGMLATFADVASALSLDQAYDIETHAPVTTDMHVRYYRQPRPGPLRAEATIVHRGRRLLSTEYSVADAKSRVLACSTATYMLVPREQMEPNSVAS
jgi:uncharacterized protein (TIGR00369 family)